MNRSLWIPAIGCLIAFVGLLVALSPAPGREATRRSRMPGAAVEITRADAPLASASGPGPADEVELALRSLGNEYLRPSRAWEQSPYRLFSRAAPRPLPTRSIEVELASGPIAEIEGYALATISVRENERTEQIPCVVDRSTKQAQLFVDGRWLMQEAWLQLAPRR